MAQDGFRIFQRDNPGRQVLRMAQQPIETKKPKFIQIGGQRMGQIKTSKAPSIKPHPNWV